MYLGWVPPSGTTFDVKSRRWAPTAAHSTIFDGFGSPFGVSGWALWGSFWRMFFETDLFNLLFSDIFVDSEKGVKMELPKGGWTCNLTTPVHVS